jgi:hypothetical protein
MKGLKSGLSALAIVVFLLGCQNQVVKESSTYRADIVIYGGTSAGVMTAVQAVKMGKSAIIVSPDLHLGGLTAGGLGWTDTGKKEAIGGLSREFYHRVWKHYQNDDAWGWQDRADYGSVGLGARAADGNKRTQWTFEPHVAEQIFEDFIAENEIVFCAMNGLIEKRGWKSSKEK